MNASASAGYTLIELLVVVALVALIVALAAPASVAAVDGARLRGDARTLVTKLRALQSSARTQHKRSAVSADDAGNIVVSGSARPLENGSRATMTAANREIVFYEDGTVSGGRIQLALGSRRLEIEVAWLTGETTVEAIP